MNYIVDRGKPEWGIAGVMLRPDRDKKSYLALLRSPGPPTMPPRRGASAGST